MKKRLLNLFDAASLFIIYLFSGLLGQVLVLLSDIVLTAFEFQSSQMQIQNDIFMERVFELFAGQTVQTLLVSNLVVVVLYWLAFCRRKETLRHYAGLYAPKMGAMLCAFASGLLLHFLVIVCINLIELPQTLMEQYDSGMEQMFEGSLALVLLTSLVIAPLVEEIVFRGALLKALQKSLNLPIAVLTSSALFALVHINPVQMGYAFVLGLILCILRLKSGSLWGCVAMHIAFNAANYLPAEKIVTSPLTLALGIVAFFCFYLLSCIKSKKHYCI